MDDGGAGPRPYVQSMHNDDPNFRPLPAHPTRTRQRDQRFWCRDSNEGPGTVQRTKKFVGLLECTLGLEEDSGLRGTWRDLVLISTASVPPSLRS